MLQSKGLKNGVWLLFLFMFCAGLIGRLEAQRHPESAGPQPSYGPVPEWYKRPPFIRGPLDRYDRGRSRLFLGTGENVPYQNHAEERYILWQRETIPWGVDTGRPWWHRNIRWDRLGNYMGPHYQRSFSIVEARSGKDNSGHSFIDHKSGAGWGSPAGGSLHLGHYSYKGLHWSATVGRDVRTYLTPLTLAQGHMRVARLDLDAGNGKDRATVFYSRGGRDGLFSFWGVPMGETFDLAPVLLYGFHWQHQIGDYASVGSSLLNQIMSSPSSPHSSALKGDLPYEMLGPTSIRVFVADDSPLEKQFNGKIYSMDIVVEGERDGEPVRLSSSSDDIDFDARLAPLISGGSLKGDGSREAVGKETVVYEFVMPEDVTLHSARFTAEVADDYRIGVRQSHNFPKIDRNGNIAPEEWQWPASFVGTEAGSKRPFKWDIDREIEEPYYTVLRSKGRSATGGNRRMVSFDYGMPTGQSLASVNAKADLVGLDLEGEVVHNLQNYMFPVGDNEGQRNTKRAWAYWLKGLKEFSWGVHLGGEVFRLEPDYSGGYDSRRGGMAFHVDKQSVPGQRVESRTQEFYLVEDNDDDDQWPDDDLSEVPTSGVMYPGWSNSRVYPGLDENFDNIPDMDRNENFKLDWEEPFLMFAADPPEFVYGIDFNNNGLPDFRENDNLADYPYRRDQKGRHFFLSLTSLGVLGTNLSVGTYTNREIVGGGKAKAAYLRYAYEVEQRGVGELQINYDLKKVEDDIADHSYIFHLPPDDANIIPWLNKPDGAPEYPGRFRPATPDLLLMQDSWVNTFYIDSQYLGFSNINLSNSLMWMRNSQAEITLEDGTGLLQPNDVRTRFTLVNKIDYSWVRGSLTVSPKFKHRLLYEALDTEENARLSSSEYIPILMAQYKLTANTHFLVGVQGFPGLSYKRQDRVEKDRTFDQKDYTAMLRITADYFGVGASTIFMGFQSTRRDYSRFEERNLEQNVLFVEIISPY